MIDATSIHSPNSTKNSTGTRDPEKHQTKKGSRWFFGMSAHIAVDADSCLVHHVVTTEANVHDLHAVDDLLHDARGMSSPTRVAAGSNAVAVAGASSGRSRCGRASGKRST